MGRSELTPPQKGREADIIKLMSGDVPEFDAYYKRNYGAVRNFAATMVGQEDAEQIADDSFLKYWAARENFDALPKVKAFIFLCAENACVDLLRTKDVAGKNQKSFEYIISQGEDYLINEQIRAEILDTIHAQVDHLPAQQQMIFRLAYFEGKSLVEIAQIMGLKPGTVRSQHHRAIKALQNMVIDKDLHIWLVVLVSLYSTLTHQAA